MKRTQQQPELVAKKSNNFLLAGNVNAAVILPSETESAVTLSTSKHTIDFSKKKTEVASKYNVLFFTFYYF